MDSPSNMRKPPNRGYRKKDGVPKRSFRGVLEDLEDRARRLWLLRQQHVEGLDDELDRAADDVASGRLADFLSDNTKSNEVL